MHKVGGLMEACLDLVCAAASMTLFMRHRQCSVYFPWCVCVCVCVVFKVCVSLDDLFTHGFAAGTDRLVVSTLVCV